MGAFPNTLSPIPAPQGGGLPVAVDAEGKSLDFSNATDKQVLDALKEKLRTMVSQEIDLDIEPERFLQIASALKNSLYWQGKQYLRLGNRPDDSLGFFPLGLPAGSDGYNSLAAFRYVFNIIRADGMKFSAVLGQRAPHVEAESDDSEDQESVQRACEANAIIRYLHTEWNADRLQKDIARHIWRTGPVFGYTFYNADGARYGWQEVPDTTLEDKSVGAFRCPNCGTLNSDESVLAQGASCSNCGKPLPESSYEQTTMQVPKSNGTKRIPRGKVEARLCTIFECSWPASAKKIKDCGWFNYEYDEHKSTLIGIFAPDADTDPDEAKIREFIMSDTESDMTGGKQAAADAREVLQSQLTIRNQRKNIARFSQYWLRPEWFELIDIPGASRKQLYEKYPAGIKLTYVRGNLIKLQHESMDEVWSVFKPGTDEKILSDPICMDVLPVQDNLNHFGNLAIETILRGIPKTIVDAALIDRKSLEENEPMPGEAIFTRGVNVGNIQNMVAKMPVAEFSGQMIPFGNMIREWSREFSGVTEALFGGGAAAPTFRSDLLRRNQALMQLGLPFDEMQSGWESMYFNGVRQMAKYSSDTLRIPSQEIEAGADVVNFSGLLEGGFHCSANEQIPLSQAEEAQQILELMHDPNPLVWQRLDFMGDQNIQRLYELFNIRGIKSRRLVEREKFVSDILPELLASGPIQAPDPMTGQMQMQPSVPPDSFEDDHEFMAQCARDFLNSKAGLKLKRTNPDAYQNVLAWGRAHQAMIPPPPLAPPPGRASAPPKPPGAKPPAGPGMNSLTKAAAAPPSNAAAPPNPAQTIAPPQ